MRREEPLVGDEVVAEEPLGLQGLLRQIAVDVVQRGRELESWIAPELVDVVGRSLVEERERHRQLVRPEEWDD